MNRIAGAIMLFGATIAIIAAEWGDYRPNPPIRILVVLLIMVQIVGGLYYIFKGEHAVRLDQVQIFTGPEEPAAGHGKRMPPDER